MSRLESFISARIARLVGCCSRYAFMVALSAVLLTVMAAAYVARNISIDTDSSNLLPDDTPWRRAQKAFDEGFPSTNRLIVVVVTGQTAELAERGVNRLTKDLARYPHLILEAYRPDGGDFFARHGLLYRDVGEVKDLLNQLVRAQPMLATLSRDPSMRGLLEGVSLALDGLGRRDAAPMELARVLATMGDTLRQAAMAEVAYLPWSSLLTGESAPARHLNRLLFVRPQLDFSGLAPAGAASDLIRQSARDLGLTAEQGVQVRLTGPVALNDEEFSSLKQNMPIILPLMIGTLVLLLWIAMRSWRIILPILATLAMGLIATSAFGLAIFGQLNLISVAFAILFLGLGVDFCIQFSVRYRAERVDGCDLDAALQLAGSRIGYPLLLAAACTGIGFFSFLPTNYRGVAELGVIAGMGMLIAVFFALTVLVALIRLMRPGEEREAIGLGFLAPVDVWIKRHWRLVVALTLVGCVAGIAMLPRLGFDPDPLNLKSAHTESVTTLRLLMKQDILPPYTADIMMPSLAAAQDMAGRLRKLPEVARATTLADFVPDNQGPKLAAIRDAAFLVGFSLRPLATIPSPDDRAIVAALERVSADLLRAAPKFAPETENTASDLAMVLRRLARADEAARARARRAVEAGLDVMLDQTREMLKSERVTLDNLPLTIRKHWLADDGRARIQVVPKGASNDGNVFGRFVEAVRAIAPQATGPAVSIGEAGKLVIGAFREAAVWALLSIILLLLVAFRRPRDVVLAVVPLGAAFLLTVLTCALIGLQLNFANIIALPLSFGIGVALNIYFVGPWRARAREGLLASSLTRGVLFSALTTALSFSGLWWSAHPGTASMGKLMMISLGWTLATSLVFLPALFAMVEGAPPDESTKSPHSDGVSRSNR